MGLWHLPYNLHILFLFYHNKDIGLYNVLNYLNGIFVWTIIGLNYLIWSSLCLLSSLPMVLVFYIPVKFFFPFYSICFPDCNESSMHILLIYLWIISMNISVLISSPRSTDRKKNPLSSLPRREPIKEAHFPLSAALRTLALCCAPKV